MKIKSVYIILFLATYMAFAFNTINFLFDTSVFKLNVYPFSQFKLYSSAMPSNGKPIHIPGMRYSVDCFCGKPVQSRIELVLQRNYYSSYQSNDSALLKANLEIIYRRLRSGFIGGVIGDKVYEIKFCRTMYEFPPYPAKAEAIIPAEGLAAKMNNKGDFYYANLSLQKSKRPGFQYSFEMEQSGYTYPAWSVEFFSMNDFLTKKLEGVYEDNKFYFNFPHHGNFYFMLNICSRSGTATDKYMTLGLDL